MINSKRIDKYIEIIDIAIRQVNFDTDDDTWKEDRDKIEDLMNNQTKTKTSSYIFSEGDDVNLLIVIHVKKGDESGERCAVNISKEFDRSKDKLLKKDNESQDTFENERKINIVVLWITDDIESRVKINKNSISMYSREIKKNNSKIKIKFGQLFFCDRVTSVNEIKITGINRYETTSVPSIGEMMNIQKTRMNKENRQNTNSKLKGYVYTANVYNFVEIYNEIGDELFRENVRLGIKDHLDVDKEIKNTLEKCPETFWYKNNGITVLVEDPFFKLDRTSEIVLNPKKDKKLGFSVINGAQTITAASEFFFEKNNNEEIIKNAKKAKVLLRIICASTEVAREISVALNRQKPIKTEDIAYTNEIVRRINDYLFVSNENYNISRRAVGRMFNKIELSLIDFARARKAISGDPGRARGASSATLLKIEDEVFTDKDIFVKELENADSQDEMDKIYKKYYAPILFASQIARKYELLKKRAIKDTRNEVKVIIENGKWYFVAFLVFVLNDEDDHDYTNFTNKIVSINDEKLEVLIRKFAIRLNQTVKNPSINSNDFKKSENYYMLKKSESAKKQFRYALFSDDVEKDEAKR